MVECDSQEEIDHYWEKLSEGGQTGQCGWLKDRYGFSWQIVPAGLPALVAGTDPAGRDRLMSALFQMTKLDLAALRGAAAGAAPR